jgi:predicted alpha-1,2-mannosidase
MPNRIPSLLLLTLLSSLTSPAQTPYNRVNPFIGTGGHGHTYPGAVAPFGMVQLSPDTRLEGWDGCSGYHYDDSVCYGFSHTHLSGTGVSDYGDLLIRPALEPLAFSHANESAAPGHYAVTFNNGIFAEMTAGLRNGIHHYRFPAAAPKVVVIDLAHRDQVTSANMNVSLADPTNTGAATIAGHRYSKAWAEVQQFFFFGQFSVAADSFRVTQTEKGEYRQVVLYFPPATKDLYLEVNVSFVGWLSPSKLPARQINEDRFLQVRNATRKEWEQQLGKIKVQGSAEQEAIFYTALYHTMIVPNRVDDADGSYRGLDQQPHAGQGAHYSVFSLWDTYRATHPLYTLIEQQRTRDFMQTFLHMYRQSGRLPVWELAANETNCMIGYHAVSAIADAMAKGILPDSALALLQAAKASAEAPVFGLDDYMRFGFLSIENESESVSKTLEYAYDDWCIAQMARMSGDTTLERQYLNRSQAWRNLLDPETGLMRPRENGRFMPRFEPREVNNHYTEANSWQYSFAVPHDLEGWIARLGGNARAEALLDSLFSVESRTVGREQADITGLIGQYAHGNEPSHHIAYLYNSIGKPAKTQQRVKQILDSFYHNRPDGLIGNEDCGQMSAWYVLSSLGFYPVCPGDPRYSIGYPLFSQAEMRFENGKKLKLQRTGKGDFIQAVELNGRPIRSNFLTHQQLVSGGKLVFHMGTTTGTWGTATEDRYLTRSISAPLAAPVFQYGSAVFEDSLQFTLRSEPGKAPQVLAIYTDGNRAELLPRNGVYTLHANACVDAAYAGETGFSPFARACFHRKPNRWEVQLLHPTNRQYSAGGPQALCDGIIGDTEWQKGNWHGIQGQSYLAVIDLKDTQTIHHIEAGFLQDTRSWIVFPSGVDFSFSADGVNWSDAYAYSHTILPEEPGVRRIAMGGEIRLSGVRYVRMEAFQYGPLPAWHPGAGGQSFIFVDEVRLR